MSDAIVVPPVPILEVPGAAQFARRIANEPDLELEPPDLTEHEGIAGARVPVAPDLDEFLAHTDAPYEWVVPNLLEARDRVILTGPEGKGKSTLLRQFGVQCASGIHPFTLEPIEPVRVLLIDCENSERQLRRALPSLRARAGDHYHQGHFRVRVAPNGMDLLRPDHQAHLIDVIATNRPELVIIGPIYKLAAGDPTLEAPAREVARVLDWIRHEHSCAFLIEAHSPYAATGNARPQRPYGASLWSRWPEFGLYLAPEGAIGHWRGARDERAWPTKLEHGTEWPWMVGDDTTEWEGPTNCITAALTLLTEAGEELSATKIYSAMQERGDRFRKKTVLDSLVIAARNGQLHVRTGPRAAQMYRLPNTNEPALLDLEATDVDEIF